jgi:hypothetical protein
MLLFPHGTSVPTLAFNLVGDGLRDALDPRTGLTMRTFGTGGVRRVPSVDEHQQDALITAAPSVPDGLGVRPQRDLATVVSWEGQVDGLRQRVLWDGSVVHLPPRRCR